MLLAFRAIILAAPLLIAAQKGSARVEEVTPKAQGLKRIELDGDTSKTVRVLVIPITGDIDLGLAPFVGRALEDTSDIRAVILEINTFGGRIDAAVAIRDRLLSLQVPTIAYVNRRAISAGALIALAADQIAYSPGASIGAATPIQIEGGKAEPVEKKVVSYMRSEMRATAEAKGRRGDIAEAMVDADIEVEKISPKGTLLTLTTDEALRVGFGEARCESLAVVLEALGLASAEVVRPTVSWAESVARFLTDPVVAGALMSLGLLAIGIELYTPGFGLAGGLGLFLLSLFFGGHMVAELAGWEEVVLFGAGVVLLGVEIFVTPGFGVAGVLGIGAIAGSLLMALIGMPLSLSWELGVLGGAVRQVLISLLVAAGLMIGAFQFLPKSRFRGPLVLDAAAGAKAIPEDEQTSQQMLVGRTGTAVTDLRPSGKARLEGSLVDVTSEQEYIEKGVAIRVIKATGMAVVVTRHHAPPQTQTQTQNQNQTQEPTEFDRNPADLEKQEKEA